MITIASSTSLEQARTALVRRSASCITSLKKNPQMILLMPIFLRPSCDVEGNNVVAVAALASMCKMIVMHSNIAGS